MSCGPPIFSRGQGLRTMSSIKQVVTFSTENAPDNTPMLLWPVFRWRIRTWISPTLYRARCKSKITSGSG